MEPGRKSSNVAPTLPSSLRRWASGSAESETGAMGLGLELALPLREVGDLAEESPVTLSDSRK